MLQPKRTKYRRPHIIRYEGLSKGGNTVAFGEFYQDIQNVKVKFILEFSHT